MTRIDSYLQVDRHGLDVLISDRVNPLPLQLVGNRRANLDQQLVTYCGLVSVKDIDKNEAETSIGVR